MTAKFKSRAKKGRNLDFKSFFAIDHSCIVTLLFLNHFVPENFNILQNRVKLEIVALPGLCSLRKFKWVLNEKIIARIYAALH